MTQKFKKLCKITLARVVPWWEGGEGMQGKWKLREPSQSIQLDLAGFGNQNFLMSGDLCALA